MANYAAIHKKINFNIVKENIKAPPASYDAYLYSRKNLNNNKQYLGVHKGAVNDGYTHSSTCEEFKKHLNDPEIPFEFSVLAYGPYNEMREMEHSILAEAKILGTFKQNYYNKHTGQFKYKGPDLKKITNLFNKITALDEDNKPLNFNPAKALGSQNLSDVIKLNFAINILSTDLMAKKKSLVGDKPYFYKLDSIEGYDINTEFEFEYAEYLFKKFF